ncbi:hypothetical protein Tco_0584226 [Tanacetum coccineum]
MSRANPQATIISEEQLVPSANRLQEEQPAYFVNHRELFLVFSTGVLQGKTQAGTQLDFQYFKFFGSIPRRSNSEMHSEGQDSPLTKLTNTIKGTYIFGMKIPDTMINDAFKQSTGYKYYRAKKSESEKAKAIEEPKEQHVSPVRSGIGKVYMRSGDQEVNVPNAFKKNVVPRKARTFTIADNIVEEPVAFELAKSISIDEQRRQQRTIKTQLTIEKQIDKDVEDAYAEWDKNSKVLKSKI